MTKQDVDAAIGEMMMMPGIVMRDDQNLGLLLDEQQLSILCDTLGVEEPPASMIMSDIYAALVEQCSS